MDELLTTFRGVGPARADALARLGLQTVRDLLLLAPYRLEHRGEAVSVEEAKDCVGAEVSVRGKLGAPSFLRRGGRRSLIRARVSDESGAMYALYFSQPWMRETLAELATAGEEVELYGRVVETKSGHALTSPRIGSEERPLPEPGTLHPVYPLTDGIGQELLRGLAKVAVEQFATELDEPLEPGERAELGVPELADAVRELHAPTDALAYERARRRVALESLLFLQAGLARAAEPSDAAARPVPKECGDREIYERFAAALPFEPTAGQRGVLREVLGDLRRRRPMRRLLQGDVGAGKTLVGVFACHAIALGEGQAAFMAPTELLAEQHYQGLLPWFERLGLTCALVTGSMPAAERRAVAEDVAAGRVRVVLGTHALFSKSLRFARLDLVVIDEQQRFGVAQKRALLDKGRDVHMLLMTATPIPRTLALTIYGDLQKSVLKERPPGRGRLRTKVVEPARRAKALGFLRERMAAGERVFWVCPRIDGEDDELAGEVAAAEQAFERLADEGLAAFGAELVHGRIEAAERARRVERFRTGAARLLVGTTIVEVGVDVPEATVMVVDGAERFGLAQLHQLRGCVGRGGRDSWCLFFGNEAARERMQVLEETEDGFAIAEEDMRRRGIGDLMGLRQAGKNAEGLSDPAADLDLLLFAHRVVREDGRLASRYGAP